MYVKGKISKKYKKIHFFQFWPVSVKTTSVTVVTKYKFYSATCPVDHNTNYVADTMHGKVIYK